MEHSTELLVYSLYRFSFVIAHDQVPQFTSDYFQTSCSQLGIFTKETPTESHNSVSLCKRYYSVIRRVYNKLRSEHPNQDKHVRLQLAVHAVANTSVPEGLTPTPLVFGAVPRIPKPDVSTLQQDQKQRIESTRSAR